MRPSIILNVTLALLPLITAQSCFENISIPQLSSTTKYIRRTSDCRYDCVVALTNSIDTSYHDIDRCWLTYKVEREPVCCEGYRRNSLGQCEPICIGCTNGRCTAPNVCTCDEGYRNQMGVCVPVCNPECGHGTCEAPGECVCHEGYEMDSKKGCIPVCDPPCQSGECIGLNICECFSGFNQTSESRACLPECDLELADCGNGTCIGPNRCQCAEGFVFEHNRCIPKCDSTCINGDCTSPNICTCKVGYVNNPADSAECIPFCNGGCQNGSCVAPNQCECFGGFEQSNDDPNLCEPSCDPMFVDTRKGECIAPNVVECNTGYKLAYSSISGRTFCTRVLDPEWGHSSIGK